MIPKIIHYCWFGESEIPEKYQRYIEGWKILMPDFRFILWNESNSPMHLPYLQNAFKNNKWANMSNFVRLHAIYEYGGIYLDTDIEVIRRFDPLLKNECFFGFEKGLKKKDSIAINNAVMGAVFQNDFIKESKNYLLTNFSGTEEANLSSPRLITSLLRAKGLVKHGTQKIGEIQLYEEEYFYPTHWSEVFETKHISQNTFTIHHWAKSWHPKKQMTFFNKLKNYLLNRCPDFIKIYLKFGKLGYNLYKKKEVLNGPFKGMRYVYPINIGSSLFPKLVGCYEECLHFYIYDLINSGYKKIINIGCGEGYYSIGLAKLIPSAKIYAYDINKEAISLADLNAKENKVTSRFFSSCVLYDKASLQQETFIDKTLIFCDAEGYERALFTKEIIHLLREVDLIIEIHDFIKEDNKNYLIDLFSSSHDIEIVKQEKIPLTIEKFLKDNPSTRKFIKIFEESRPEIMEWAIIKSR